MQDEVGSIMKVIGKDIGDAIEHLHAEIESRLRVEAERSLQFESGAEHVFSNIMWQQDKVVIRLHNGVPTHALPHIVGVALEHVRQRLERYPAIQRPAENDAVDGPIIRAALRELVFAPAANHALSALALDVEWEDEQRHQALKDLLRDYSEWEDDGGDGILVWALLVYARGAIEHPTELWRAIEEDCHAKLPDVAKLGTTVARAVTERGWTSPGACLESLIAVRKLLNLETVAPILDRRTGEMV